MLLCVQEPDTFFLVRLGYDLISVKLKRTDPTAQRRPYREVDVSCMTIVV